MKKYDVYFGKNYPHRILQNVTKEDLDSWCDSHGYKHDEKRDTQRGVIFWDAFVEALE